MELVWKDMENLEFDVDVVLDDRMNWRDRMFNPIFNYLESVG